MWAASPKVSRSARRAILYVGNFVEGDIDSAPTMAASFALAGTSGLDAWGSTPWEGR